MRVLCLYVPRLPVRLAERVRPNLEDQAVVFVSTAGSDGLVTSCSGAAASEGIVCGMLASEARRLVPGAIFLPDNATQCLDELERAVAILRSRATPHVEVGGRDHLFVDFDSAAMFADDESLGAERLRGLVRSWLGDLEVRAGVGSNRRQALAAARKARRFPIVLSEDEAEDDSPVVSREGVTISAGTLLAGSGPRRRASAVALAGQLKAILGARGESFRQMTIAISSGDCVRRRRLKVKPATDPVTLLSESLAPEELEDAEAIRVELGALCPDLATLPYAGGAAVAPVGWARRANGRGVASSVGLLAAG